MSAYRTVILLAIFLMPPVALTAVWVRLWRAHRRIPSSFFLAAAGLGLFLSLLALISLLWPGPQGGGTPQTWCGVVLGLAGLGSCCACLLLGAITLPVLAVTRGRRALAGRREEGTPSAPPQARPDTGRPAPAVLPGDLFRPADLLPPTDLLPPEDMFPAETTPGVPSPPDGWVPSLPAKALGVQGPLGRRPLVADGE